MNIQRFPDEVNKTKIRIFERNFHASTQSWMGPMIWRSNLNYSLKKPGRPIGLDRKGVAALVVNSGSIPANLEYTCGTGMFNR
jgi:hypothetical protein